MAAPLLTFESVFVNPEDDAFNGVFLGQDSYKLLLQLSDTYFNLDMYSPKRKLPCLRNSYMIISRSHHQLLHGIGKKACLTVDKLIYNEHFGVLVALVYMRNNFTCNQIPHIVIAKRDQNIHNAIISRIIDGECSDEFPSQVEQLCEPIKVRGRIGIMIGSDEIIQSDIKYVDGVEVQETQKFVQRPEVAFSVEAPLPSKDKDNFISFNQFKQKARQHPINVESEENETMKITIEPGSGRAARITGDPVATGEYFKGEPIMKGPRGGTFITKDGKKIYTKENGENEKGADDVVYKVSKLSY
jgi:hypothetical protein